MAKIHAYHKPTTRISRYLPGTSAGKDLSFYAETTWESKLNGPVDMLDVNGILPNIRLLIWQKPPS